MLTLDEALLILDEALLTLDEALLTLDEALLIQGNMLQRHKLAGANCAKLTKNRTIGIHRFKTISLIQSYTLVVND